VPFLRFSNVSGNLLSLDGFVSSGNDGAGGSVTYNNGNLYFGGNFVYYNSTSPIATNVVCLRDPKDSDPSDWTCVTNATDNRSYGYVNVVAVTNGNAVYVAGIDSSGWSDFSRWVVGPDAASPEACITNGYYSDGSFIFTVVGTPGSHWQVVSSPDGTTWTDIGELTLWTGTNNFTNSFTIGIFEVFRG
jgi:hypothetical protein